MGSVRLGVPEPLVLGLRDALGLRVFVETGMYKGGTTAWAARHFDQVVTVEAYEPRYRKTLAGWGDRYPNITAHLGDSGALLAGILAALGTPAVLWLDAHFCGNSSYGYEVGMECPLRHELAAVNASRFAAEHAILIDDARLFQAPPPYPHRPEQWPTYLEVEQLLHAVPGRVIAICEDVILCVPEQAANVLDAYVRQVAVSQVRSSSGVT